MGWWREGVGCRYLAALEAPQGDGLYYVGVYGENLGLLPAGESYSFTLQVRETAKTYQKMMTNSAPHEFQQ